MHQECIHDQSHKRKINIVVNVVHPNLGYVHNDWILYYVFGNYFRLVHQAYKYISWLYFSPPSPVVLQCKPLSLHHLLHSNIDSYLQRNRTKPYNTFQRTQHSGTQKHMRNNCSSPNPLHIYTYNLGLKTLFFHPQTLITMYDYSS